VDPGSHALAEPGAGVFGDEALAARLVEFTEKAEPLGVRVWRVETVQEAGRLVAQWAGELGADRAVLGGEVHERIPAFSAALREAAVRAIDSDGPEAVRDAPLGVSLARLAVAETGSVLLVEPTLADRSVSMLTLSLAVVCPFRALVASLDDAAEELRRIALEPGASFATLVTGPSRTADIERVLTVGVQGPGVVVVVFVDEL
jgi:L-lactate dehydrogenase complex protein LldG